jgi:phosphatidylglycerol:prolipoprotein diacylglycerol transferase
MLSLGAVAYPPLDPVAVQIGPVAVRWYGLAYVASFLLSYVALRALARRGVVRLARDDIADLLCWLVVGVVAGGRAGWWFFYHRADGAAEPWYEPLAIWHGGMSFHGGLIGVLIVLAIWSTAKRIPFLHLTDALALLAPIGLFLGRLGNFVNAELVGRPTTVPWGVIFPGESFPRHPSQLYEAVLEGPVLLLAMWLLLRRTGRGDGLMSASFLILYGLFRFLAEFTRQPDAQLGFIALGWLTMGQLLSVLLLLAGLALAALTLAAPKPPMEITTSSKVVARSVSGH